MGTLRTPPETTARGRSALGIGRVLPLLKATNESLEEQGVAPPLEEQTGTVPVERSRLAGGGRAHAADSLSVGNFRELFIRANSSKRPFTG